MAWGLATGWRLRPPAIAAVALGLLCAACGGSGGGTGGGGPGSSSASTTTTGPGGTGGAGGTGGTGGAGGHGGVATGGSGGGTGGSGAAAGTGGSGGMAGASSSSSASGTSSSASGSGGAGGTGGAGVGGSGGSGGSAPSVVPACAPPDTFDDPTYWNLFLGASATSSFQAGVGAIEVDDFAGEPGYAGFSTVATSLMQNCGVWVTVTQVLATDDITAFTFLSAPRVDGDHVLHMYVDNGLLVAEAKDGDPGPHTFTTVPFDPVAHARWRIRDDGTANVFFDISADGISWSNILVAPRPTFLDTELYNFSVGAGSAESSANMPWHAGFDDFDVTPPPQ